MQSNIKIKHKENRNCEVIKLSPLRYFDRFFEVESGLTQHSSATKCHQIYRLRHKVYCETYGYLPENIKKIELDEFDYRSSHVAITHQKQGDLVGCTRVVNCYAKDDLLPVELLAEKHFSNPEYSPKSFSRDSICEISRLAVDQEFKQNLKNTSPQEKALYPYLALQLYYNSVKLAAETGRPHVFLLSESRLIRSARLVGINIIPIGDYVAHKGLRKPCYINAQDFIDNLPKKFLPMYQNDFALNTLGSERKHVSMASA